MDQPGVLYTNSERLARESVSYEAFTEGNTWFLGWFGSVQGYLAHKKPHNPRTLQKGMPRVLGGS